MIVAAMDTEGEKTQVAIPLSRYFWDPLDSLPAGLSICLTGSAGDVLLVSVPELGKVPDKQQMLDKCAKSMFLQRVFVMMTSSLSYGFYNSLYN